MTETMWMADYERIPDDYLANINGGMHPDDAKDYARAALRSLGFDRDEIEEQIAQLAEDCGE